MKNRKIALLGCGNLGRIKLRPLHALTDVGLGHLGKGGRLHGAQVGGVEVGQLLNVKDSGGLGDAGDVEGLHQLLGIPSPADPEGGQQAHGGGDDLGGLKADGLQKIGISKHGYSFAKAAATSAAVAASRV